ncbi:MAG: 2,4-dihydroxyhept-2-ene-1,7-dioic acid aldolase [Clostridiales bacterium]|nr:2,4-dihydroxyhept-2-ene-1,7-dioic acid aldolase [Clostridiales bacterium]
MTFKEKLKQGPVFGMACFTGTTCVIESIAQSGLDFIYLDLEHTNYMLDEAFEKQIMAARLHDVGVLVRMADDNEVAIRKVLEWGADGVVVPHCKTAEMARRCVEAAKFSPMGRRGGESNVRAAGFGYRDFDWNRYMREQNENTLVIPMDEDFEFTENLDEILDVPGVDAINFGPIDYAVSCNLQVGYAMGDVVREAFGTLVGRAKEKKIGVLGPVVPPTRENLLNAVRDGYTMIIVGNDMWHFQQALKGMMANAVEPARSELEAAPQPAREA